MLRKMRHEFSCIIDQAALKIIIRMDQVRPKNIRANSGANPHLAYSHPERRDQKSSASHDCVGRDQA